MVKVSVIIPTYNRYETLVRAVKSVQEQTHTDTEIIVVNDGSTQLEYENKIPDVVWIDLKPNTKQKFGFPCPGHVRNQGIEHATGEWIAFLDDDDYWFLNKIEVQLQLMETHHVNMACSEANTHKGLYNGKVVFNYIKRITGKLEVPGTFDLAYIRKNNIIIFSSLIVHRDVVEKVGSFMEIDIGGGSGGKNKVFEDYEFNKKCLEHTNCVYSSEALLYYDL